MEIRAMEEVSGKLAHLLAQEITVVQPMGKATSMATATVPMVGPPEVGTETAKVKGMATGTGTGKDS